MRHWNGWEILAFVFSALMILIAWRGPAHGHGPYTDWRQPNNPSVSCCNDADCRPTRAFIDDDGNWEAWNGTAWLVVPWDRILATDMAHDGRSHLCEVNGYIYCFSPAEPKG